MTGTVTAHYNYFIFFFRFVGTDDYSATEKSNEFVELLIASIKSKNVFIVK